MTNRQKAIGVTEYGYERGIKDNEWRADYECFLAKLATVKKGEYILTNLVAKWIGSDCGASIIAEEIRPYVYGASVNHPDKFYYTNTFGLDCLTVK